MATSKKQTKTSKKPTAIKRLASKAVPASTRPLHRRISLHPISLMIQLCAGVFLVAATISAAGDSYSVTATIPAAPLTAAAVFTAPADQTVFTDPGITVTGTCPSDASYVTLTQNGAGSGTGNCTNGAYSIATTLTAGSNQLVVQDYNITNQAGPATNPVTVFYNPPATPAPAPTQPSPSSPTPVATPDDDTLQVMQVDTNVAYVSQSDIEQVDPHITLSGTTTPFAQVTLEVHSNPVFCYTQADQYGYWQCAIPTTLPPGQHTVLISAITPDGRHLSLPIFRVLVVAPAAQPVVPAPVAVPALAIVLPTYKYQVYVPGQAVPQAVTIAGGHGPYSIVIDWGDGTTTVNLQPAAGSFTQTHHYHSRPGTVSDYTITTRVIDAAGNTVVTQTITHIRNNPVVTGTGTGNLPQAQQGWWQHTALSVHNWLWLLWPAYLIVLLMLISFWLGERRQYDTDHIMSRRAHTKRRPAKHHA